MFAVVRAVAITVIVCAIISIGAQSWATYTLRVPEPEFGGAAYSSTTVTAYLWGALTEPGVATDCLTNQVDEIVVRNNVQNAALNVLTLGLWTRTEIRYRCGKPDVQPGTSE